jgi:hypothetical protein
MSKPHDKTHEILGTTKVVRAIKDVVYQAKEYRGRKRERVDGKDGSYDFVETHVGDQFACDASFAKQAENAGQVVLLSGGRVTVTEPESEFPIYARWNRNLSDPPPVYERCELLKPLWLGDGCLLPEGFRCRLDVQLAERTRLCYEDEQQTDAHAIRVLKLSPKKIRISQAEQAGKVNALFDKFFPAQTV